MKNPRGPGAGKSASADRRAAAAELAIAALVFLAGEQERIGRFLALTGLAPESLRTAAREPGFLLGVLDHVASDEALLLAFANESGIDPQDVAHARDVLSEGPGDTGAA
jgi:predicted Zn-dependent protease